VAELGNYGGKPKKNFMSKVSKRNYTIIIIKKSSLILHKLGRKRGGEGGVPPDLYIVTTLIRGSIGHCIHTGEKRATLNKHQQLAKFNSLS
jgi:hypothetical protein